MELKLTYTVHQKINSWNDTPGIKSNLADDDTVRWEIAKSLSDALLAADAAHGPEKLLLEIAECKRREIQAEIENMDDVALVLQAKTDQISQMFDKMIAAHNEALDAKRVEFNAAVDGLADKIEEALDGLDKKVTEPLKRVMGVLDGINDYKVQKFTRMLADIATLQREQPELLDFVVNNFKMPVQKEVA